jgi:hypothetical protein
MGAAGRQTANTLPITLLCAELSQEIRSLFRAAMGEQDSGSPRHVSLFLRARDRPRVTSHLRVGKRPAARGTGIRRSARNDWPRRLGLRTIEHEGLRRETVLRRRRRIGPTDRERADRGRWRGKSASRDELNLLTTHGRTNSDGLELPIAAASAGQSQGSRRQKKDKGPEPFHGDLLSKL